MLTGPDLSSDAQAARDVRGADGETIAHGAVERWVIAVGKNVGSEHAPGGFHERNVFGLWRLSKLANLTQNGGASVEKGKRGHVVQCSGVNAGFSVTARQPGQRAGIFWDVASLRQQ